MFICPSGVSSQLQSASDLHDTRYFLSAQDSVFCRSLVCMSAASLQDPQIILPSKSIQTSCAMPGLSLQTDFKHALCWINNLGTNTLLLKRVTIQLQPGQAMRLTLNLLHLLKIKWRHPYCISTSRLGLRTSRYQVPRECPCHVR
jgi:hypothetical protein